jgi:hypothetical protein
LNEERIFPVIPANLGLSLDNEQVMAAGIRA